MSNIRRFYKGANVVLAWTPRDAVDLKARGYTEVAPAAPVVETAPEPEPAADAVSTEQPVEHIDHPDEPQPKPKAKR